MEEKENTLNRIINLQKDYEEFKNLLPDNDKNKLKAIQDALKILTENNVMAILFAEMPSSELLDTTIGFSMNTTLLAEFENDKLSKKSQERIMLLEYGMASSYLCMNRVAASCSLNIKESEVETHMILTDIFYKAIDYSNYYHRGIPIPAIEKLKEES